MAGGEDGVDRSAPLSEADFEDINRALGRLEDAARLIDTARSAGIDVEPFEQRSRETRDRLLKIKQAFFPGR